MSEVELAQRFIACRARISGDKLRKGQVAQKDWPKVVRACNELEEAPLWFDDSSDLGVLDLRAKARRLHAQEQDRGGLGLIIVDYLQLMRTDDPRANRVEQVGQISRGLKILARELEVPVLAISQLSRAPEQRHPPKPMLSDLRESGNLEQDADVVAFLFREDYYRDPDDEPDGLADLIIAKHRNGPIGSPKLVFLDRFPKFADFAGQDRPIEQPAGEGAAARRRRRRGAGVLMPAIARSEPFREQACPLGVCDGSGWILGPEDVARECECRAPAAQTRPRPRRRLGDPAALPRRLLRPPAGLRHGARPADQGRRRRGARLRRRARRAASSAGRGLWLFGDTGTGKTTLAMLVSKAALEAGHSVAIYSLPKLLARIRRTYDSEPGGDSYLAFFERLTSVDLLHIDDLGAEKRSDWVLEQLYALINERYEAQRSVLVTTNLPHEELEEQIGSRTVSRLSRDLRRGAALRRRSPLRQGRRSRPTTGTMPRRCQGW